MLLGGTVAGQWATPEEWEALLVKSRFMAITAPFDCHTDPDTIAALRRICDRHDVVIAELGVWKNLFDPDPQRAAAALEYAKGQLALADASGIPCCVNIAGTSSPAGWDAADPDNYTAQAYARIVDSIRGIIDAVRPTRTYYCLEPMPWMVPDGPEEYLHLIRDVDRPRFAVHMDFVNMINSPRRYLASGAFIEECFEKLAPYIRSTHIKDTRMHPTRLTTVLEECSPGEGSLDFERVLGIIDRWLPADAPVLLEHMTTFEEYAAAYDHLAAAAARAGIAIA